MCRQCTKQLCDFRGKAGLKASLCTLICRCSEPGSKGCHLQHQVVPFEVAAEGQDFVQSEQLRELQLAHSGSEREKALAAAGEVDGRAEHAESYLQQKQAPTAVCQIRRQNCTDQRCRPRNTGEC